MTKSAAQLDAEIADALRDPKQSRQQSTIGGANLVGFDRWSDVVDAARRGDRLWYHGAMDRFPKSVLVIKVFKNGNIRIDPLSNQASKFTAGPGHLKLFLRRA